MGLCVNLAKVKAWSHAVRVARKHIINWLELVICARLGKTGVFRARAGGEMTYDAKTLLKELVRLENAWQYYGDVLNAVRFEDDSLVISEYFGRDFRIPLRNVSMNAIPPLTY